MEYPKIETLYERDPVTFKVNPTQLKNRVYGIIDPWEWTEKIDGTNIRCVWQEDRLSFGGRTDAAQLPANLVNTLHAKNLAERFQEHFRGVSVVVYGEGYGAGIQKGGGAYSATKQFAVFDVLIDGKWWLSWENVVDVAAKLGLVTVPSVGTLTLADATRYVQRGFRSALNNGARQAEGLVGRPLETLFDKKGQRVIVKLKTKDF